MLTKSDPTTIPFFVIGRWGNAATEKRSWVRSVVSVRAAWSAISARVVTHMPSSALTPSINCSNAYARAWAAGNERVVGQDPAATLRDAVRRLRTATCHGPWLGILDDAAAGPPGVERVLFPVVQCPVHRDFDRGVDDDPGATANR